MSPNKAELRALDAHKRSFHRHVREILRDPVTFSFDMRGASGIQASQVCPFGSDETARSDENKRGMNDK